MENHSNDSAEKMHFASYLIGFALSILLTLFSYFLVTKQLLVGKSLPYTLLAIAFLQAAVQLRLFLHLGEEPKPRWKSALFFTMLFVLLILVVGSLWIMTNLDERMMVRM